MLIACSGTLSPERVHTIHARCLSMIARGRITMTRSRSVGFHVRDSSREMAVVIYGADWCRPCHLAESYLEGRGVPFVLRDVEEDPAAKAELEATLQDAGLGPADSLPVLDVRGTVIKGFAPCLIEAAWSAP